MLDGVGHGRHVAGDHGDSRSHRLQHDVGQPVAVALAVDHRWDDDDVGAGVLVGQVDDACADRRTPPPPPAPGPPPRDATAPRRRPCPRCVATRCRRAGRRRRWRQRSPSSPPAVRRRARGAGRRRELPGAGREAGDVDAVGDEPGVDPGGRQRGRGVAVARHDATGAIGPSRQLVPMDLADVEGMGA